MIYETISLNEERNVTLTAMIQPVRGEFSNISRRPAVLILPGGGYGMVSDREADPVAMSYLAAGFDAFILRYSVRRNAAWPNPLEDYDRAMSYIRDHAKQYHILPDRIAVVGFSAGGHLAAAAATMSINRPNAAVLVYAVTTEDVKGCNESAPEVISKVDKDTPPCFLCHSRTDGVVPVQNSLKFMMALAENNITFESHIYDYGPHGFSTADSSLEFPRNDMCSRIHSWVTDSISFLRDVFGEFGPNGLEEPRCGHYINSDHKEFLSDDCTLGKLSSIPQAAKVIEDIVSKAPTFDGKPATLEEFTKQFPNMKFSDICKNADVDELKKVAAAAALAKILNPLK